jgi:hypothetical protein
MVLRTLDDIFHNKQQATDTLPVTVWRYHPRDAQYIQVVW